MSITVWDSLLPRSHPAGERYTRYPDPTPSVPTAPQLRAFGAASTLSAIWSRHLGGLSLPTVNILATTLGMGRREMGKKPQTDNRARTDKRTDGRSDTHKAKPIHPRYAGCNQRYVAEPSVQRSSFAHPHLIGYQKTFIVQTHDNNKYIC